MSDSHGRAPRVTKHAVSYALVAAAFFIGGVVVGGSGAPAVIAERAPFFGDQLDATPDQRADLSSFWKAWNALNQNYVITHASTSLPSVKDRLYGAISGLADSYNDPYTVFFPPVEAKKFAESISGSFGGLGVEIDVKDRVLTVVAPLKGTPAEAAGMQPGDIIAAIDGRSTDGISTDEAVSKIRGPIGTVVTLTLIRDRKSFDVSVTRATIQVPETEDGFVKDTPVYRIALYQFTVNSADLFNQAFGRFKESGATRLIVDLRGNPGGYLDAAVDIASHFLPKGAQVVIEDFGDTQEKAVHTSAGYNDLPSGTKVVVLVDGGSASASEIVAGALQDAKVATVIGTKSFGKGSVQTLIDLDGGSLKVTVARWVTPAGHWIMGNGITPDIIVPYSAKDAAAKTDPQKARAVEFLTTGT
ncbi:MAG: S41 family peptidase [Patescibacteria group bacterium]